MKRIANTEVERFNEFISTSLGLHFDPDAFDHLAEVLLGRLRQTGCAHPAAYWERLGAPAEAHAELRQLAVELTVPETYFYRHPEQCQAFADVLARGEEKGSDTVAGTARRMLRTTVSDPFSSPQRPLRILSAGCASGEEAYSLATIALDILGPAAARDVQILGIDINPVLLEKARRGRYSQWSLRATNARQRQRHFRTEGREFVLHDAPREMVKFQERNLVEDGDFWSSGQFDIVFCRNVIIYFTPPTLRSVIDRISGALVPGGLLFLGSSETLRGVSQDFNLRSGHSAFYYQRRQPGEPSVQAPIAVRDSRRWMSCHPGPLSIEPDDSWFGRIGNSSRKVALLAERSQARALSASAVRGPQEAAAGCASSPRRNLDRARELLSQERFADVIEELGALTHESEADPDALLLRAVALTNAGRIEEAERVCMQVLACGDGNAGAHYLRALCREQAGDRSAAIQHDRVAIDLDPRFAMPRLHLGLMAQRDADVETARLELRQALLLLSREDVGRILLFGGGFNRESLSQLCRSALRTCGGMA